MDQKVNFFVIGAQKAGTTALERFLRQHLDIQMGRHKELHFFDNETLDWTNPDYSKLDAAYDWSRTGVLRGEATPIYMYWPNSLERLKAYNPHARLIVMLRHPVMRAHSHWKMEVAKGKDDFSFRLAVSDAGRMRVKIAPNQCHRVYSYVERGFYSDQIARIYSLFPLANVLFLRTEDLWQDLPGTLNEVASFLGVSGRRFGQINSEYIVPLQPGEADPIPRVEQERLTELFDEDILDTSLLTGLNLDHWRDPNYAEPMNAMERPVRAGLAT